MITFGKRRRERRQEQERQWRALVGSIPITERQAKELTQAEHWFYATYIDVEQSRMLLELDEMREVRAAFARIDARDGERDSMQEIWDWYGTLLQPWKPVPPDEANVWREVARLQGQIARSDDPDEKRELRVRISELDALVEGWQRR
jgi:hypothetical protein